VLAYLTRRLAISLLALVALSLLAALLVRLVPGDPVTAMLGMQYTETQGARLREQLGLDRSWLSQYAHWMGRLLQGDLDRSLISDIPIHRELAAALPVTLQLLVMSMAFALLFGPPLGMLAAMHQKRWPDGAATLAGLIGLSLPGFWLAGMLILFFDVYLGWTQSSSPWVAPWEDPLGNLQRMILPAIALGLAVAAVLMRMTRTAMVETLGEDYMRTARAKGLGPWRVTVKHALRNAWIPILTITGIQAGYLLGGSVVIEEVFNLNGLGRLMLRAVSQRDYPVVQACIVIIGGGFLLINLLVDLLYALMDPRIRQG